MKRLWLFLLILSLLGIHLVFLFYGSPDSRILWELRLPRLLVVLAIGSVLAGLGATYQVFFNNPLADPYVLGISSAVTLGAAIAETFFHFEPFSIGSAFLAILIALLSAILLVAISYLNRSKLGSHVILFGLGLNFICSSLVFLLLSYSAQQLGGGSMRWLFGQIPWITLLDSLGIFLFGLIFLSSLWLFGPQIDALAFGDAYARTLGLSPKTTRALLILFTSLGLGLLTASTGAIGFIGLVIPHVVRMLFQPHSTRQLLLGSIFLGSGFLALSDLVSRNLLPPMEFPIGIITTVLGAPFFLWLLWRKSV